MNFSFLLTAKKQRKLDSRALNGTQSKRRNILNSRTGEKVTRNLSNIFPKNPYQFTYNIKKKSVRRHDRLRPEGVLHFPLIMNIKYNIYTIYIFKIWVGGVETL